MGTKLPVMFKLIAVALCAVAMCHAGEPTPVNTGRQVVERLESDWLLVKLEIDEVKKLFTETEELESSLEAMNKTNADMLAKSKTLEKNLARCSKDLDEEVVRCSLLNEQSINETVKADAAISKNALCAQQVKGCDKKIKDLTTECKDKEDALKKKADQCADELKAASGCCNRVAYLRNE